VIVVTGATGAQGGSVVEHLLKAGTAHIRAVTRDPTNAKAQALTKRGVEVVKGDLSDKASIVAATRGAAGLFLVTQFWEKLSEEDEFKQGKNAIDAAKENKVGHVIFSGLPGVAALTSGRIRVPHFDGKWRLCQLLRPSGLCYSLIFVPFYFDNYVGILSPQPSKDNPNEYTFCVPMAGKRFKQSATADVGGIVVPMFSDAAAYNGKLVDMWAARMTLTENAQVYAQATGRVAKAYEPKCEEFAQYKFPGADELAAMFQFFQLIDDQSKAAGSDMTNPYAELGFRDNEVIAGGRQLYPAMQDFATFLRSTPVARRS